MSGGSKCWVDDVMYIVDDEVVEHIEQLQAKLNEISTELIQTANEKQQLQAELEQAKYVIGRFERWYSDNGCPYSETKESFCPRLDELKKDHDEEMAELDEDDRFAFDPSEDCGYESNAGWCYARYYEKLFKDEK